MEKRRNLKESSKKTKIAAQRLRQAPTRQKQKETITSFKKESR